jgi:hypothetical protein
MNLAGAGSSGSWRNRGRTCFFPFFEKWAFRAHETTGFKSKNSLEMRGIEK